MSSPRPTPDRLLELVDLMAGRRLLMLVDLVVDRFVHGTPKRISREAPVLILRFDDEVLTPGGGANAVANVRALGGVPIPVGVVGDDAAGSGLVELFTAAGIETRGVIVRPGFRTPTKTRILAGGRHAIKQQVVRYDIEDELEPSTELDMMLAGRLTTLLAEGDLRGSDEGVGKVGGAVVSDYGYGAAHPRFLPRVRDLLGDRPVLGDSRYRLGDFAGLDGATPNLEEAEHLLGAPLPDDDRARLGTAGTSLLQRMAGRILLVTRGSAGMSLFARREGEEEDAVDAWHLPVHGTDQVADVTGAGDTVIGAFSLALAAGASPLEAACLANYAGGIVVMKMGTATASPDELRDAIRSDPELLGRIAGP